MHLNERIKVASLQQQLIKCSSLIWKSQHRHGGILKEHVLNVEQRLGNEALGLVDRMEIDECEAKHGKLECFDMSLWSVNKAMVGTYMQ